jgi:hypothetical protein
MNIVMDKKDPNRFVKRWISEHRDQFNEIARRSMKKNYPLNREKKIKDALNRYYWKKEQKIFLNILL